MSIFLLMKRRKILRINKIITCKFKIFFCLPGTSSLLYDEQVLDERLVVQCASLGENFNLKYGERFMPVDHEIDGRVFKVGAAVSKRKRPLASVKMRFDRDLVKDQSVFFKDSGAHKIFVENLMAIKAA